MSPSPSHARAVGTVAMSEPQKGHLIVLSGPSGVGKTTLLKGLLARFPEKLKLSTSATTRPPRPGERDGIDYYFLTPEEFERRREAGEFLEACEVFGRGYWYGTPYGEVTPSLEAGKSVILEIDVEGTERVLESYPEALTIFVRPSSPAELERRLRERATESEESVQRRLEVARRELALADRYQYQVVNDKINEAIDEISQILKQRGGMEA